jgi:hypothetical protein
MRGCGKALLIEEIYRIIKCKQNKTIKNTLVMFKKNYVYKLLIFIIFYEL